MKKLLALLLAVVMILCMTACSGNDDDDEEDEDDIYGLYMGTHVEIDGEEIDLDEIFDTEMSIELKKNDKAVFTIEGVPYDFTYELDGRDLSMHSDDDSLDVYGTLKNDIIEIDFEGYPMFFELEK